MNKLLIVDDEPKIREVIREYAEFNDFEVSEASDGMEAVGLVKENDYDMIVMDVMMPKLDGFSACKEIKLGIDDYVTKPFSPKELMARISAVLARHQAQSTSKKPEAATDELSFGGLVVNIPARTVTIDGTRVDMTPKEYDLLFYLVEHRGLALSREVLLKDIWDYDFVGEDRTIDTHIKNLRNNLGPYRDHIVTLRGVGYKFEEEI